MLAAARKYNRVVQVGTQRRSTPHLVEARNNIIKEGKLGNIAYVEICCYYHMRHAGESAGHRAARRTSTTRCGPDPRRCGRTTSWSIRGRWRAFMEYGNGIVGDMCIHMYDMVRWMMDLGLAEVGRFDRRHSGRQAKQGEHHRHADSDIRSSAKSRSSGRIAPGAKRPIRSIPGRRSSTATKAR